MVSLRPSQKKRNLADIDQLVAQSGVDAEIANQVVAPPVEPVAPPPEKKPKKLAKSKDPQYHKTMLYFPKELFFMLKGEAAKSDYDMSDIVTRLLMKHYPDIELPEGMEIPEID
ncbi:MAG: hypothetical protein AAGE59_26040 [Cyanobacteria bacterium P01_F01_bin.86]